MLDGGANQNAEGAAAIPQEEEVESLAFSPEDYVDMFQHDPQELFETYQQRINDLIKELPEEEKAAVQSAAAELDWQESPQEIYGMISRFHNAVEQALTDGKTHKNYLSMTIYTKPIFLRILFENLIYYLQSKGVACDCEDTLIIDMERLRKDKALRKAIRHKFQDAGHRFREEGHYWMFEVLAHHIPIYDTDDKKISAEAFFNAGAIDTYQPRKQEILEALEQHKARRLRLNSPEEKLTAAEAEQRTDENYGLLCIWDEKKQVYKKVSVNWLERISGKIPAVTLYRLSYDDEVPLRRSDLKVVNFIPRRLSAKNATSMINKVRYHLPQKPFAIPETNETVTINPETDRFIKLSNDYGAFIVQQGAETKTYLLRLASPQELQQQTKHKHRLDKGHGTYLTQEETVARLEPWDPTKFIPPQNKESQEAYAQRVLTCADIGSLINAYREVLDGANFDLQQYSLRKQLLFTSYYAKIESEQGKKNLLYKLRRYGAPLFNAFQACALDLRMGEAILKIATKHNGQAHVIFEHFTAIAEIFNEQERQWEQIMAKQGGESRAKSKSINLAKYYSAIMKRGVTLLQYIEQCPWWPHTEFTEYLEKTEKYHQDVVKFGALMAAASLDESGKPRDPAEINEFFDTRPVHIVQGGNQVKAMNRTAMGKKTNYNHPKKFGPKTYTLLADGIRAAHAAIDPGRTELLIDNIPYDLQDPTATFIVIEGPTKPIGIIKFKPDPDRPGHYYLGSMYVDESAQKGFDIGTYLQKLVEKMIPEGAPYGGTVNIANIAMQRHIEQAGGIGTGITTESNQEHTSNPLVRVDWRTGIQLQSKNKQIFTTDHIKKLASRPRQKGRIRAYIVDTSLEGEKQFARQAKQLFSQGYVMSRFFYEDGDAGPKKSYNQNKTYVVFEKPQK